MESIITDTLERLLRDSNEDHERKAQASEEKARSMRWEHHHAINEKKIELKRRIAK